MSFREDVSGGGVPSFDFSQDSDNWDFANLHDSNVFFDTLLNHQAKMPEGTPTSATSAGGVKPGSSSSFNPTSWIAPAATTLEDEDVKPTLSPITSADDTSADEGPAFFSPHDALLSAPPTSAADADLSDFSSLFPPSPSAAAPATAQEVSAALESAIAQPTGMPSSNLGLVRGGGGSQERQQPTQHAAPPPQFQPSRRPAKRAAAQRATSLVRESMSPGAVDGDYVDDDANIDDSEQEWRRDPAPHRKKKRRTYIGRSATSERQLTVAATRDWTGERQADGTPVGALDANGELTPEWRERVARKREQNRLSQERAREKRQMDLVRVKQQLADAEHVLEMRNHYIATLEDENAKLRAKLAATFNH